MTDPLIGSLLRAVEASPQDVPLRLHLAALLLDAGRGAEAVQHCAVALQHEPDSERARELMARALGGPASPAPNQAPPSPGAATGGASGSGAAPAAPPAEPGADPANRAPAGAGPVTVAGAADGSGAAGAGFDWDRAEVEFGGGPAPAFVTGDGDPDAPYMDGPPPRDAWDVEAAGITLADVGGMEEVKERLEVAFLAPMRNPELRRLYGKSLRGGLLLYGPPGCGKTFVARAVAGQMGASFISAALSDVLDAYVGQSEQNVHTLFRLARSHAPAVLFLDEIDAIGHKRTHTAFSSLRNVVNQLLTELDGIGSDNDGVYVLAATNAPWDVDPALRRPGRLDRSIAVLPPDEPARAAILHHHLRARPCEGVNLAALARTTEGFTGADLAHLCDSAIEIAMMDSVRTGRVRMVTMADFKRARKDVRPSARPWFDVARNVVTYADASGEYAELAAYMKRHSLL